MRPSAWIVVGHEVEQLWGVTKLHRVRQSMPSQLVQGRQEWNLLSAQGSESGLLFSWVICPDGLLDNLRYTWRALD